MDERGSDGWYLLAGVLVAAFVAALGGAALADGWQSQARAVADCESETFGACLGQALLGGPLLLVGVSVAAAAVWLAQRVMGTAHPEWGTVLGTAATTGALLLWEAGHPRWVPPPSDLAALLAGVGVAIGVTVVAVPLPRLLRAALAVALAVPFAVYPNLSRETRRADLADRLDRAGLPLLVSRAEGFAVKTAWANPGRRFVVVTVGRKTDPRTDGTSRDRDVTIRVVPVPADFAPPARCGPTVAELRVPDRAPTPPLDPSCRPVGPDHWTRTEADVEVHLLRRGDALVLVQPDWNASDGDAATVAGSLTEVAPRRLADLAVD
ncbi:hypothetical protein GA0074692_4309 [Micromonospora pallida]|uniref:Uncharacterized protein n=1 Tax=Micromonospora pallida TaxID=145854 RepID=A0A1C6T3C6_9ACTN|nr:hypothetical protein [Micromonospora pallida]SCL36278.1 hypothetical protein GA0074692_4309 [Micromonospora pallida]